MLSIFGRWTWFLVYNPRNSVNPLSNQSSILQHWGNLPSIIIKDAHTVVPMSLSLLRVRMAITEKSFIPRLGPSQPTAHSWGMSALVSKAQHPWTCHTAILSEVLTSPERDQAQSGYASGWPVMCRFLTLCRKDLQDESMWFGEYLY